MKVFLVLALLCDGIFLTLIVLNVLFGFNLGIGYYMGLIALAFIFSLLCVLTQQENKHKVAVCCIVGGLMLCYGGPILGAIF